MLKKNLQLAHVRNQMDFDDSIVCLFFFFFLWIIIQDRGYYMCQMNTDPMKSALGYLDVVGM